MTCSVSNSTLLSERWTLHWSVSWIDYLEAADHSLNLNTLFSNFSILDSAGQDIKYCHIWDVACQTPQSIFSSIPFFTVCSLYNNITQQISDGRVSSNWTAAGFSSRNISTIQTARNVISSGLISYCALIPECASKFACLADDFYTSNGALSGPGIAKCWQAICEGFSPYANQDFGGIGVRIFFIFHWPRNLMIRLADKFLPDANRDCAHWLCGVVFCTCLQNS